ncbi:MAG: CBS domain-containing protein [Pyrinomonadaceae bacterium]
MQVREIMTPNPACCTPDSTLQEVAQLMKQKDCGLIPVVNSHSDMRPVGTITDRDITIRTVAASHNPINMKAADIMTSNLSTVKPEMSVEECFNVMEDREIRRVLVVDDKGKCCGIVAQADVVQSGANPVRTNKVIREISESAPSRNQNARVNGITYQSHSSDSYFSGSSLLPLLIGVGSGAALMYLLNNRQDSGRREYFGDFDADYEHENRQDLTNQENFGKYVNAEQEVEKRRQDLGDRVHTLRTELDTPNSATANSLKEEGDLTINNKGRSAGQGS